MKYHDVFTLLKNDPKAKRYFDTLPGQVREQICTRAESVNSFASLQDYAENLTRGDN